LNIGGNGEFNQQGGSVTLSNNFDLHGNTFITSHGIITETANYVLGAGYFTAPSMVMGQLSSFHQYTGTNLLTGANGLNMNGGVYGMENGRLETSFTGVGLPATFNQRAGIHKINGVFSLTGNYDFSGGMVDAAGYYQRGFLNVYTSTDFANFIVHGLTDFGGTLWAAATNIQLGQLRLSTNGVIGFRSNLGSVICANSSGIAWTSGQTLVISNWHNGFNHISFGTSAAGLTPSQLAQVEFLNPMGMPGGYYRAQILSNGELVPAARPTLQLTRFGSKVVLTWPSGNQLTSATNVTGPYTPVSGATSPWTNSFPKLREFFKLQGL
jgi:hypothetical protein